ncbi:MAG: hypothetical protein JNK74_24260 [Candidatus Hydrogenedentes bacterium]|nr:hypothetical protein [Candidatus Hydrogenedentota bacterium]
MNPATQFQHENVAHATAPTTWRDAPWQIWVVVTVLGLEGLLGNLPAIAHNLVALWWLAAKVLFITGLLNRWRWVFVLNIVVGILHVLAFSTGAPFIAFLNLVLVLLVASAMRFYFPRESPLPPSSGWDGQPPELPGATQHGQDS